MARMSIDDMIVRDTRIDRLAKLCGWSRRETRACLEDVWALCYDRVVPYLDAEDIEVTAARDAVSPPACADGFVAALRAVGLARDATAADRHFLRKDGTRVPWPDQNWRGRVYLSGASERVGYLLTKRTAGSEGGVRSGESRRSKAKQCFASASSETQARGNPSSSASSSAPDSVPEEPETRSPLAPRAVGQANLDIPFQAAPPVPRPRKEPTSDHQRVIAAFDTRYRDRFGHPPTWGPKQAAQVKQLIAKHPADEVIRRIAILFDSPPAFLAASAPDVGTLVQHFDKLVTASLPLRRDGPAMPKRLASNATSDEPDFSYQPTSTTPIAPIEP